jgi:sulfopyruvate decarboxylase TPP-binding subunit
VRVLKAESIVAQLKSLGITHAVGLSDTSLARVFALCQADPEIQVVPVCREGEAFAIAAGLCVGGKSPVVIIQNTGFLESGDAIRGTLVNMKLPVLILISYRGYKSSLNNTGVTNASAKNTWIDSAATFLEPTLRAWGLPYLTVESNEELSQIAAARELAVQRSGPAAVLVVGNCV